jgi:folate-binding protein YgfZ
MPSDWSIWGVYGPDSDKIISLYFPDDDLPEFNRILASNGTFIWRSERPIQGILLLVDPAYGKEIDSKLAASEGVRSNEQAYEIIRIKAGFPDSPNEINENYIPLEVDLWDAVSFSKGCYVGQEIIARMESRGKLARKLVGLRLSEHAPIGSPIFHGKRNLGVLTSIMFSPDEEWIGLAVIKTIPGDASEATLLLGDTQVEGKIFQFV